MVKSVENQDNGGVHMLSISDWIAFLTSEKHPNIGNIIGFTAVIIAVVAIIMSIVHNWGGAVGAALICVALLIIYFRTTGRYGPRAKAAEQLLDEIMSGKERDPSRIEERWKAALVGERKTEEE